MRDKPNTIYGPDRISDVVDKFKDFDIISCVFYKIIDTPNVKNFPSRDQAFYGKEPNNPDGKWTVTIPNNLMNKVMKWDYFFVDDYGVTIRFYFNNDELDESLKLRIRE